MSSSASRKLEETDLDSGDNGFIKVQFEGQTCQADRPRTYEDALFMIRVHFPSADAKRGWRFSALLRRDDGTVDRRLLNIPPVLWQFLQSRMTSISAEYDDVIEISDSLSSGPFQVTAIDLIGKRTTVDGLEPSMTIRKLKERIYASGGPDPCQQRLTLSWDFDSKRLKDEDTLQECGISDGALVHVALFLRGDKPVVYLFPPVDVDASVQLSLVPEWQFDVLYPPTGIKLDKESKTQTIQWDVHAKVDGTMVTKDTGVEVSYLFWEAMTTGPSGHAFSPLSPGVFVPGTSDCQPKDSVLLASCEAAAYLDKVLSSLGLHTEARTSFITYWLPAIKRHEQIALRFVPQAAYESSAPMSITPKPDIVVRVFMLFEGIRTTDMHLWDQALPTDRPGMWNEIVGIGMNGMSRKDLFRVLEWGGMEVKKLGGKQDI